MTVSKTDIVLALEELIEQQTSINEVPRAIGTYKHIGHINV